ncbi:MAG: 16S rRNA (guanine(966)-N(2))-methyltransferase RsmD [Deltaproteobacteria bacterium]|jgi:16S rRNA (guanine966-N2)-methyltransferase|nr:16S rRNA (guanine(966)-N(2))-methyltransferase RsmD [Deltaproteobacteria bacterium]
MRIIAGEYRGRQLKTTTGPGYRPAMGKVRGALFSMLEAKGFIWSETRVLDLFAGSGSLGFEALSRGASKVAFVESMPQAAALIRENAQKLDIAPSRFHVFQDEVGKLLNRPPLDPFEIVFIDPPYGKNLLSPAIKALLRKGWLAPGGVINAEVESGLKFDPAAAHPELDVLADRSYGQTRVILWNRKADQSFIPEPSIR